MSKRLCAIQGASNPRDRTHSSLMAAVDASVEAAVGKDLNVDADDPDVFRCVIGERACGDLSRALATSAGSATRTVQPFTITTYRT
jgi:hypothetical protein